MARREGKIITISSSKGGVGKSTICLALADYYSSLDKKVLVIDGDLYNGIIAMALNLKFTKTLVDATVDIQNNSFNSLMNYVVTYDKKFDVMPSNIDPKLASSMSIKSIDKLLDFAVSTYDVILVDLSHEFDSKNIMFLDRSYNTLFVLNNNVASVKGMKSIVATFLDSGYQNFKVLLNDSILYEDNYFSLYDIKSLIQNKIDFNLTKHFYIRNYNKHLIEGTLIKEIKKSKEYTKIENMGKELIEELVI